MKVLLGVKNKQLELRRNDQLEKYSNFILSENDSYRFLPCHHRLVINHENTHGDSHHLIRASGAEKYERDSSSPHLGWV